MKIYKLTFGGGSYEDSWSYSIIFSSFLNAETFLFSNFFNYVEYDGYNGVARWNIKEGIIDTEEWTMLANGSIHNTGDGVILYLEHKEIQGKISVPVRCRAKDRTNITTREVDNVVTVKTLLAKAFLINSERQDEIKVEKITIEKMIPLC